MFLRKDAEGNMYYFPYGKFSKGFKLNSPEEIKKIKNVVHVQSLLPLIIIFVPLAIDEGESLLRTLPWYFPTYFLLSDQAIHKLKKSSTDWSSTSKYEESKRSPTLNSLIWASLVMLAVTFLIIWTMLNKANVSFPLGVIAILFCGIVFIKSIKKLSKMNTIAADSR